MVIVRGDGTKEVLKKALVEDGTVYLLLEQDAEIRIVSYENSFADVVDSAWYASAVDFAAGRGLLSGVSETAFAPEEGLSRGMLVTALYAHEEPGETPGSPCLTTWPKVTGTPRELPGRWRLGWSPATGTAGLDRRIWSPGSSWR